MSCGGRARSLAVATALVAYIFSYGASAQAPIILASTEDLKKLSVEELMNVQVYSASRRLEPTQSIPSAIYVLTQEDIRRSRVTNVPDALRLVPGVQVGRVDANRWAVSIRGFNSREANKLLVLVDGRSVYDQLFSGMLWESQDLMLEDVDRIEVIRGPGGTLWGANAVNGVINIITRNAKDTQGALITALAGNEERYTAGLRYGWQTGENQYARVYLRSFERDTGHSDLSPPYDQSRAKRGGFRWDWGDAGSDRVRVSGDIFRANTGLRDLVSVDPVEPGPLDTQEVVHRGTNLIARWLHPFSETNNVRLAFFFDRVGYESETFDQTRKVYDFEFQQTLEATARHQLVWGFGHRRIRDSTGVSAIFAGLISIEPAKRNDTLNNVFIQDTIALVPERWSLTLGTKYEDTDYARSEWQPNARLAFTPDSDRTIWASASRAVRVPSRLEADLTFFGFIRPGDTLESERVNAYEFGLRQLFGADLSVDIATFYNRYQDLATSEASGQLRNSMEGHTYGFELATRWMPAPLWRLDFAYSHLRMNLELESGSAASPALPRRYEGLAPRHQATLRSAIDLPHDLELDTTLRFVDDLSTLNYPSYVTLDFGLAWHPHSDVELALVGQNLLDSPHPEQAFVFSSSGIPSEVERGLYGKATWRF
jgi:iron complex outermembrane recepter protein